MVTHSTLTPLNPYLHGGMILLSIVLFLGICIWAWSAKRNQTFDQAAHLPLEDDDPVNPTNPLLERADHS